MNDLPLHRLVMTSRNVMPPGTRFRDIPDAGPLLTRIEALEAAFRRMETNISAVAEMTSKTAALAVTEARR
jgi:hypothetical protein